MQNPVNLQLASIPYSTHQPTSNKVGFFVLSRRCSYVGALWLCTLHIRKWIWPDQALHCIPTLIPKWASWTIHTILAQLIGGISTTEYLISDVDIPWISSRRQGAERKVPCSLRSVVICTASPTLLGIRAGLSCFNGHKISGLSEKYKIIVHNRHIWRLRTIKILYICLGCLKNLLLGPTPDKILTLILNGCMKLNP